MRADLNHLILLDEFQGVTDLILIQCNLIVGVDIHEIIQIAVGIQILHVHTVDVSILKLLGGTESFLHHAAADNVLQFRSDKCCAFARLYMLKFDNLIDVAVNFDRNAVSKIAS